MDKEEIKKELMRVGYQIEAETPFKRDWLIAITNNPDIEKAFRVFNEIAIIWAKEVGIPNFALEDYKKTIFKIRKKR